MSCEPLQEVFGHFGVCMVVIDYQRVVTFLLTVIRFVKSHEVEERACNSREGCLQWKLYLMPAKAIKPNNRVFELDQALLFEEDLSLFRFHHLVTVEVLGFKVIQRSFLMPVS